MSKEEKNAIEWLKKADWFSARLYSSTILNLIENQQKEIEELKETLKCTQNSWFEDTQKIEEMKKQLDLDNECEIALNNKIMDLEKEIEELKKYAEGYKLLSYSLDNFISKDKIKPIQIIDLDGKIHNVYKIEEE